MTPVALFYCLRQVWPSGMTSFTAHLSKALDAAGLAPTVYRPSRLHSNPFLSFGGYKNVMCQRVTVDRALSIAASMPSIIVASGHPRHLPSPDLIERLMERGARLVLHDPTEFANHNPESTLEKPVPPKLRTPPIVIRESMLRFFPSATHILHPYARHWKPAWAARRKKCAVCTARIATAKRPRLILQTNRLLPKKLRIELRGSVNRMVAYGLTKTYSDVYTMPKTVVSYPQTFEAPVELCAQYRYHVDMSVFPMDGGGTQYAQLEAIDAGCVPVMSTDWFAGLGPLKSSSFVPGTHVLSVGSPLALADLLTNGHPNEQAVLRAGQAMLRALHDPELVGRQYRATLGA